MFDYNSQINQNRDKAIIGFKLVENQNAMHYWIDQINQFQRKINDHKIGEDVTRIRLEQAELASCLVECFGGESYDYLPGGKYNKDS